MKVFGKRVLAAQPQQSLGPRPREIADELPLPVLRADPPPAQSKLRERVLNEIDPAAAATMSPVVLRRQVEEIIHDIANAERLELSGPEQVRLADELANDMIGYGPLQSLLMDEEVSDIMVNGPARVYVEKRGQIERTNVRFRDSDHIDIAD